MWHYDSTSMARTVHLCTVEMRRISADKPMIAIPSLTTIAMEVLPDGEAEVRQGLLRSKLFGRILLSRYSYPFGFAIDCGVG